MNRPGAAADRRRAEGSAPRLHIAGPGDALAAGIEAGPSGRPRAGRTRCGRPPRHCGRARNWRPKGQSRRRSDSVPAGR